MALWYLTFTSYSLTCLYLQESLTTDIHSYKHLSSEFTSQKQTSLHLHIFIQETKNKPKQVYDTIASTSLQTNSSSPSEPGKEHRDHPKPSAQEHPSFSPRLCTSRDRWQRTVFMGDLRPWIAKNKNIYICGTLESHDCEDVEMFKQILFELNFKEVELKKICIESRRTLRQP